MTGESPARDAMLSLARDLVEEIAAGRALELANTQGQSFAPAPVPPPEPPPTGAAAVHPGLGSHLLALPGDTISGHAYAHLQPPWMTSQPGQPAQGGPPSPPIPPP